jgi:hypothetical protein
VAVVHHSNRRRPPALVALDDDPRERLDTLRSPRAVVVGKTVLLRRGR